MLYLFVNTIASFIELLSTAIQDQKVDANYNQVQKDIDTATVQSARVAINAVLQNLESARTAIDVSEKALVQATLAGAQGTPSIASAQVKIALGALRSAQANYEKTLVRTPITGVVNALYLKTGEYVSPSQKAAIVSNSNGLQISSSVSLEDSEKIHIGDTVTVDNSATGTVTALANAIDPTTGKVAIKISIDDTSSLKNGSTVSIVFTTITQTTEPSNITVPLASLKLTGSGPVAFTVSEQNTLVSHPVTLGALEGSSVVVIDGLTADTVIVVDARGLKDGQVVTVQTN